MKPEALAAQALWPDAQDWLVSNHGKDISKFYHKLFDSYLTLKLGRLTPEAREAMIKALLKNIIS